MSIPGITYKITGGAPLTHQQLNDNFRSLVYSSSLQDNGETLRLHYDTSPTETFTDIALSPISASGIVNNNDKSIVVGTGTQLEGKDNLQFDGSELTLVGKMDIDDGEENVTLGKQAGGGVPSGQNTTIGIQAGQSIVGKCNTVIGYLAAGSAVSASNTVGLGEGALKTFSSGDNNVALGKFAGEKLQSGAGNLYVGNEAGPTSSTVQNSKLYINNTASDTPLILGDFDKGGIKIKSSVTASYFSGSFIGDGSNLTGVTATAAWDGNLNGNAKITGSLVVSGSDTTIDFTNTKAVSGSIFSGSFYGDGSNLTGIQGANFPYVGIAQITGSLLVSGALAHEGTVNVDGQVTATEGITAESIKLASGPQFKAPVATSIGIGSCVNTNSISAPADSVTIGNSAGVSAGGCKTVSIGRCALTSGSIGSVAVGFYAGKKNKGNFNIAIGQQALGSDSEGYNGANNVAIGYKSQGENSVIGTDNVTVGNCTLTLVQYGSSNVAIGTSTLANLASTNSAAGDKNTAIGHRAGFNTTNGRCNVYLGHGAGPSTVSTENEQLYISNKTGTPLIKGDFSTNTLDINGTLTVSESIEATQFSGSYIGDGSQLTGVAADWDGNFTGNATIDGKFTVTTGPVIFEGVEAISGSNFSGSFAGDGSSLTGISFSSWDGQHIGAVGITGSLEVLGKASIATQLVFNPDPSEPIIKVETFYTASLGGGTHTLKNFSIGGTNGYSGVVADYLVYTATESQKKIGTLYGSWDNTGDSELLDNDAIPEKSGSLSGSYFDISSNGSAVDLSINLPSTGTYNVHLYIKAFKKLV